MKAKFTSGEWSVYDPAKRVGGDRRLMVLHPDGLRLICRLDEGVAGIPEEERLANARLIAAAPRLYRTLSELAYIASAGFDLASLPEDSPRRRAVEAARAALAQAEGGEG